MKTFHGSFKPKNPNKYNGTLPIVYRSSWELAFMIWLDNNIKAISWSSESIVIPYLMGDKPHRYFPDFKVTYHNNTTYLYEIKPYNQTNPPVKPSSRKSSKYINEQLTYVKNICKWKSAINYCLDRGWNFRLLTEKELKAMGVKIL